VIRVDGGTCEASQLRRSARKIEKFVGQRWRARFWIDPSYHAIGCIEGNQHVSLPSIVRRRDFPSHRTVLPPSAVPMRCIIVEKPLKMAHFSKTGSRNMAETCAINFLTLVSYTTSIVIWGLRRLLLRCIIRAWAGLFVNFAQNRQCGFHVPIHKKAK